MNSAGTDRETIQKLAEIAATQEYIVRAIDEIKTETRLIKEQQVKDSKEMEHIKADILILKELPGRVKNLEDERNVNIVKLGSNNMHKVITVGIAAVILSIVMSGASTFVIYYNTMSKLSNIVQTQQKGANP